MRRTTSRSSRGDDRESPDPLLAAARDGWGVTARLGLLVCARGVAEHPAAALLALGLAAGTPELLGVAAALIPDP